MYFTIHRNIESSYSHKNGQALLHQLQMRHSKVDAAGKDQYTGIRRFDLYCATSWVSSSRHRQRHRQTSILRSAHQSNASAGTNPGG
jgi:hypothetical protein